MTESAPNDLSPRIPLAEEVPCALGVRAEPADKEGTTTAGDESRASLSTSVSPADDNKMRLRRGVLKERGCLSRLTGGGDALLLRRGGDERVEATRATERLRVPIFEATREGQPVAGRPKSSLTTEDAAEPEDACERHLCT